MHIDETRDRMTDRELLLRIDERLFYVMQMQHDHERRLRSLEVFRWMAAGAGALIASIIGLLPWRFFGANR